MYFVLFPMEMSRTISIFILMYESTNHEVFYEIV